MQALHAFLPANQVIVRPPIYFGREIPYHERVFESFLEAIRALPLFP